VVVVRRLPRRPGLLHCAGHRLRNARLVGAYHRSAAGRYGSADAPCRAGSTRHDGRHSRTRSPGAQDRQFIGVRIHDARHWSNRRRAFCCADRHTPTRKRIARLAVLRVCNRAVGVGWLPWARARLRRTYVPVRRTRTTRQARPPRVWAALLTRYRRARGRKHAPAVRRRFRIRRTSPGGLPPPVRALSRRRRASPIAGRLTIAEIVKRFKECSFARFYWTRLQLSFWR